MRFVGKYRKRVVHVSPRTTLYKSKLGYHALNPLPPSPPPPFVRSHSSDHLALQIGKMRVDDGKEKENIKKATLNPEFFRAFEFQITMPGESQLKLKVNTSMHINNTKHTEAPVV